jgi:methyltransferase (TIGR00027 family)
MREIHTRFDKPALIDDTWARTFVPSAEREAILRSRNVRLADIQSVEAALTTALRASAAYPSVILRTRWAEDALEAAVARGVRQYVIIGAGMDSLALRQPEFARRLRIIEVDHPATQGFKRERLRAAEVRIPPTLEFVPADLAATSLDSALENSSYRKDEAAFFAWLGVTMYLTREANFATLRSIARCSANGSELAFTYVDQLELDPARQSKESKDVQQRAGSFGEAWLSGFAPAALPAELRAAGLVVREDLDGEQICRRYYGDSPDALRPLLTNHYARAFYQGRFTDTETPG